MAPTTLGLALAFLSLTSAQQIGKLPEVHPRLLTQKCTTKGGCVTQKTSVVLDAGSHPLNAISTGESCLNATGGIDTSICSTAKDCGKKCAYDGTNYADNGVRTRGDSLHLREYLRKDGKVVKVSPRLYLLAEGGKEYVEMQLVNQELSFDVDMSNLPCGMNAALYLGAMDADGGRGRLNPAGATYGTGYCDAQCYTPTWLNGVLNEEGLGACCNEMDIWESNARATGYTPHACNITGFYGCEGDECGPDGVCDKPGCGFNPYANGAKQFYGLGREFRVDTTRVFTVTTQFISANGKANGRLKEIRRKYKQNGKVIHNVRVVVDDSEYDSITSAYCTAENADSFQDHGGLKQMGEALSRGMVLTFALWNDDTGFMNWLDAGDAGPCNDTEGDPKIIIKETPDTNVTFSKIKWGDIGSTS